jgi:3-oxoadipate enol-lactonase
MVEAVARKAKAADGCEIFYRVYPQSGKPRVALIHSLGLDGSLWDEVIPELAPGAEILALDCRGHGQSERRAGAYTTDLFARDLLAAFDDCGWDSAVVAGCSMGGYAAQAFGATFPNRTRGLALIDTSAWYGADAPEEWRKRAATAEEKGFASMLPFQLTRWFGDSYRETHQERIDALTKTFVANSLACYQSSCGLLGSADLRDAIRGLRMPVSVIVGEEDYATPPEMARAIHAAIPGSSLTVIAGGRHLTPLEFPGKIAELLKDLLQRSTTEMGG